MNTDSQRAPQESLHGEMRNIIEETRVVLPGIQALFGFQTIVVFNERFADLPEFAKDCHLIGLSMVVISIALVVFPAAYYRYVGSDFLYPHMLTVSTRVVRAALLFLAVGLTLDMFTVIYATMEQVLASLVGAGMAFLLLIAMWFLLPMGARRAAHRRGPKPLAKASGSDHE